MEQIAEKLKVFNTFIPDHVCLVAVSKTKPVADILAAYEQGQRDFGENKVQEMCAKAEELPKDIRWHMIGHLQRNKVKMVVPVAHLIHGVDSLRLLNEIQKEAAKIDRKVGCLLQVHIAKEESKFGLDEEELAEIMNMNHEQDFPNIVFKGLMGMATFTENQTVLKREFSHLKSLFDQYASQSADWDTLSMGMSNDFALAIEEGSTMVRIGSAIFGERNYS
jgi:hypothetical protein